MASIKELCGNQKFKNHGSCGFVFSTEGAQQIRRAEDFALSTLYPGKIGIFIEKICNDQGEFVILKVGPMLRFVISCDDNLFIKYVERDD